MNPLPKQESWLCHTCDQPRIEKSKYCKKHRDLNRTRSRNRYRKAKGIPLNAPLYHRKHHELEKKSTFLQRLRNLLFRA